MQSATMASLVCGLPGVYAVRPKSCLSPIVSATPSLPARLTRFSRVHLEAVSVSSSSLGQQQWAFKSAQHQRAVRVQASAATSVPAPAAAAPQWKGAALKPLGIMFLTGIIIWFIPPPQGVAKNAWQLLAIFLATIVGIITQVQCFKSSYIE